MRKFACLLIMALSVSGCSVAGVFYYQTPVESAGWNIHDPKDKRTPHAEFICDTYKYNLPESITKGGNIWFGPPLIPIIPPIFMWQRTARAKDVQLRLFLEGGQVGTLRCPMLVLEGAEYKAEEQPGNNKKGCYYTISNPNIKNLTAFIEDQMGCKVSPLNLNPTSEFTYLPFWPPQWLW